MTPPGSCSTSKRPIGLAMHQATSHLIGGRRGRFTVCGIVRPYTYDKDHGDAIARFAAEFLEILKQYEGYVSHHWINSGDGDGVSGVCDFLASDRT